MPRSRETRRRPPRCETHPQPTPCPAPPRPLSAPGPRRSAQQPRRARAMCRPARPQRRGSGRDTLPPPAPLPRRAAPLRAARRANAGTRRVRVARAWTRSKSLTLRRLVTCSLSAGGIPGRRASRQPVARRHLPNEMMRPSESSTVCGGGGASGCRTGTGAAIVGLLRHNSPTRSADSIQRGDGAQSQIPSEGIDSLRGGTIVRVGGGGLYSRCPGKRRGQ